MAVHALGSLSSAGVGLPPIRLLLRARARLGAPRLDERVAFGESPNGDALLALRVAHLLSGRTRKRLAAAIERACHDSERRGGVSAAIPVHEAAVDVARPALEQLAAALRSEGSVNPRGVALTELLLTEPTSVLYAPRRPESLYEAAREALFALGGEREG
jgi:hypothetical protein